MCNNEMRWRIEVEAREKKKQIISFDVVCSLVSIKSNASGEWTKNLIRFYNTTLKHQLLTSRDKAEHNENERQKKLW